MRGSALAFMFLAAAAGAAAATTIHLNAGGTGDYPTIAAALSAAQPGDTILAAPGLYTGPGNTQLDFAGKDLVLMGSGPEATILDCQDSGVEAVRFHSGETRAAVLRDMTLRNNIHVYVPTGIVIDHASPTLANLHLSDFNIDGHYEAGAALHSFSGSPLVVDTEVRACWGSGVQVWGGSPEFERVLVEDCHGMEYVRGGGMIIKASARLKEVIIRNCTSFGAGGGGVACYYTGGTFEDCRFENNEADSESGYGEGGGGLACFEGAAPHLLRCVFIGNDSRDGGGGLAVYEESAPILDAVLFADNESDIGGAILLTGASASLSGVTIVGSRFDPDNDTMDGPSAFYSTQSSFHLENVILAFSEEGVGIWADAASQPVVLCCDVFLNPEGNYGGSLPDQTGINGNISEDPIFCEAAAGDYSLDATSPCLPANNDCGVQMGAFGQGCGETTVDESLPAVFSLDQNHPNPFNPLTTLNFGLPRAARVHLTVYDASGRRVARLLDGSPLPAGYQALQWRGTSDAGSAMPSGVYFACFEAEGFRAERKLILLR